MTDSEIYNKIEEFIEAVHDELPFIEIELVNKTRIEGDVTVAIQVEEYRCVISFISKKDIFAIAIINEDDKPAHTQLHPDLMSILNLMLIITYKNIDEKSISDETLDFFSFVGMHEDYWQKLVDADFVVAHTSFTWNEERGYYPEIEYLIKHYEREEDFERCDTLTKINKKIEVDENGTPEEKIEDIKYDFRNTWDVKYDIEEDKWKLIGKEKGHLHYTEIFFEDMKLLEEHIEEYNLRIRTRWIASYVSIEDIWTLVEMSYDGIKDENYFDTRAELDAYIEENGIKDVKFMDKSLDNLK